ncbi:hypothetical protein EsDP_00004570 [Epichloe bromicola]|uniref:Crh-like protein n=1 Tax=Epichloe bromicola TaxID=79588 RepID=A0ABQ0CS44_9HYPO
MLSNLIPTVAVALAASSLVSAQTSTDCNPLKKDCPPDPAFGKNSATCDFTKGPCDVFEALGTTPVKYESRGGVFEMSKAGQAPTLRSRDYIFFGRVEVEMQAAPGKGVISCLVLQSDDLDEIDFETVGSDTKQIQTNYFYKGDTTTYDRGALHPVDDILTMHTYALDWTPDKLEWLIDGKVHRTVRRAEIGDGKFPQGPMQVKVGTWVAGYQGNNPGTIKWAGGIADFSNGPSSAIFKTIKITDYSGGYSATSKDVKEYVYGDRSGSASSIRVKLRDGSSGGSGSSGSSATSATNATNATSAPSTTAPETTTPLVSSSSSSFTQNTTTTTANTNNTAGTVGSSGVVPTSTTTPPVSGAAGRNAKAVSAVLAAIVAAFALKTWHSS